MKKIFILIFCAILICTILTACAPPQQKNLLNYQRKYSNYNNNQKGTENTYNSRIIDLSEGPKLNYDKAIGPRDLNFDVTVKTRY